MGKGRFKFNRRASVGGWHATRLLTGSVRGKRELPSYGAGLLLVSRVDGRRQEKPSTDYADYTDRQSADILRSAYLALFVPKVLSV